MITIVLIAMALQASPQSGTVSPTRQEAQTIFTAAGFAWRRPNWRGDCQDPGTAGYEPPRIDVYRDLNGDGHPDAIVVEGSSFCYGASGYGYVIVSGQPDGSWRRITTGTGLAVPLETTGADGWPDLEIGGPGFCFPVLRWDGDSYAPHRRAYNGQPCR